MSRILLLEDEESLARGLIDVLSAKGYQVSWEQDGEQGLQAALAESYDLLLLDVELPGIDGFEILKSLRQQGRQCRVMMLTARDSELDRVRGFELDVDDYVCKPFSLSELLGRVKALLRRSPDFLESQRSQMVTLGEATLDLEGFKVSRDGREIRLPAKAIHLLRFLIQKAGQVVSRDELIDAVWGEEECITQRTLNNLVVKVRQAIEARPEDPKVLKTVHGVGYRLDVTRS